MKKIREDIEENSRTAQEKYGDELTEPLKKKLEWFKNQKIGVIFHWGLYAEAGIVESWQLSEEDDWARKNGGWRPTVEEIRQDYWRLNQKFNPVNFNAQKWAEICREAGFRYMIFTTKHHDGFAMYDTAFSDYKLTGGDSIFRNDYRSDAFGEIAREFRKAELAVGAYYSKADWHSPYYWLPGQQAKGRWASYDPAEYPEVWSKFNSFVTNQLTELSKNYGPLDILWLDGGWVNSGHHEFLDMDKISENVRGNQPNLLIVDRTIGGKYENYVTPERKIPVIAPQKAWESNIPLAKNWGYVPNDSYKSFDEILESLVEVVCLGGNLILGIGPKPDGSLPEEALNLLDSIGDWLKKYGQAIYDTRPQHFENLDSAFKFVSKEKQLYGFIKSAQLTKPALESLSILTDKLTFLNDGSTIDLSKQDFEQPVFKDLYAVVQLEKRT